MKLTRAYYLVILFSVIFTACEDDGSNEIIERLQGDWLSTRNEYGFISVKDTLILLYGDLFDEYVPYHIHNDTLIIQGMNKSIYLSSVSDKYISTKDTSLSYPIYLKADADFDSNLTLKSVEVRFSNVVNKYDREIVDWAVYLDDEMNCFLNTAERGMYKNPKGKLSYEPGEYSAELAQQQFEYYQNKFRSLPLSEIKREYISDNYLPFPNCYGMETSVIVCEIEFELKNTGRINRIKTVIKGAFGMPGYLASFIKPIYDLYGSMEFGETEANHTFVTYGAEYSNLEK